MNMVVENINKLVNERRFNTSDLFEYAEFAILCVIAAGIPLILRHPQLLVGVMVNFALMITAVNVRGWKKVLPLIMLPSIAATVGGFLFGSFTIYLVFLIPVIWIGNATLVFVIKYLYSVRQFSYLMVVPVASVLKMMILYSVTFILVFIGVLPNMFLTAMGLMQMTTALVGGFIVYPVLLGYQHYFVPTSGNLNKI